MRTTEQQIKTLTIIKSNLNCKLIDFENGTDMIDEPEYNEIYNQYIATDKKIEALKAGL
jgi:hypothetical protein